MIFNVERGVFRSFSTRHQFYTFTKLKSYVTFPFFLQLFLFFLLFLSSHLPCPTLFARDPILFSPTGNTILTRSEVQLTMDDRSSHFSRKIPRKRLKNATVSERIYMIQFKVNELIFHALIWHVSLFNGL